MSHTSAFDNRIASILADLKPHERVCALTGEKWFETQEEIDQLKKYQVPPHPWAPQVRLKHMMGFPSGIAIWKKPHAETGRPMLTFVHPDSPFQIIEDKDWHSREFTQTKQELDAGKSFFDQFKQLAYSIPVGALRDNGSNINTVGVDLLDCRDSYCVFSGYEMHNLIYAAVCYQEENSILMTNTKAVNESYHCNAIEKGHNLVYCLQNGSCMDSAFLFDCVNCRNCFGATNKRNRQFVFFNEQLSEQEYHTRVEKINLRLQKTWDVYSAKFLELIRQEGIFRYNFNFDSDDESTGEYLIHSTRCKDCYWQDKGVNLRHCWIGVEARDSYCALWIGWGSNAYLSVDLAYYGLTKFCMRVWKSQHMEYCMDCYDCENCFGCVGMKKKKFHIFNRPYAEDEYWRRVDEIKCAMLDRGEYGLFFPSDLSQAGFQFSMGQFFLGYSEANLKMYGAPVFDPTKGNMDAGSDALDADDLPDHLDQAVEHKHIGRPIFDKKLGRMFTIPKQEYEFYKRKGLPLPRQHFLTRLTNLIRHSNMPIPEEVACGKCQTRFTTYKNPTFPVRTVYCKPCYLKFLEEHG